MTTEQFYTLELNDWKNSLDFYATELEIFRERLAEVAKKNSRIHITAAVESYENQFTVQKDVLQTLQHDIRKQQHRIVNDIKTDGKLFDLNLVDQQFILRDRVHMAEKILLELKHSFYRFLSKAL